MFGTGHFAKDEMPPYPKKPVFGAGLLFALRYKTKKKNCGGSGAE